MTTTTIIVIIIVIIIIVIVILLSTCLTIFTIWCIRRTRKKKQDQRIEEIEMPNISDFKEFENSMIPRNSIRLLNFIGEGEFAVVYKAHLVKNISTSPLQSRTVTDTVAVKTLKGFHDKDSMTALLEEALRMKNLDHPNILTLIGICTDNSSSDSYIVLPYMSNGSLRTHLIRERKSLVLGKDNPQELVNITTRRLMVWCLQVAEGMKYLAAKGLVHRDLAARNCMLGENLVIKIADFGFSEKLYTKLYVRMVVNGGVKLPVKWMAPESLLHGIFSEKSDVWSFGVTCWEIFTGGVTPYPGVHASAIPRMRNHERMMEKPDNTACSEEMYSVMLDCWEAEATDRPSFSYLVRDITVEVEKIAGGYLEIIV